MKLKCSVCKEIEAKPLLIDGEKYVVCGKYKFEISQLLAEEQAVCIGEVIKQR